jgi:hypothetical protein
MPGHQRRAVPPAQGAGRPARRLHVRGRRRPVDLRLARRETRTTCCRSAPTTPRCRSSSSNRTTAAAIACCARRTR